jgi:hypothetical protein
MAQLRERADAMLARVTLETSFHLGRDAAAIIRAAAAEALAPRDATVADDHDPRLLHPARTLLILLSDAECREQDVLAASLYIESVDVQLRPGRETLAAAAGAGAAELAAAVPLADAGGGADDLLERLVSAPEAAAVIAVAERLDHARHLHLREDLPWAEFLGLIEEAYVPAARRLSPPLAHRLERWAEAFRVRRLLRRGRPA